MVELPRSNVRVAVNVYRRAKDQRAYLDKPFLRQVRGKSNLRELLSCYEPFILNVPVRDIDRRLLEVLSEKQRQEIKGVRCPCGRLDYGAVRGADGAMLWGYLWQFERLCLCMRSSPSQNSG